MNDWKTTTLQYGAATIIVRQPILAETERIRRENRVRDTLASVARNNPHDRKE